ncbi:uncharacterized protein LOC110415917 isoform X2 [Herrania umbratica]|uniref:Uncharacterized protein LOC110415917 isoform X2 n=1 Tax=Herrania umbratica TaxID=108875 RepID=A0A6J1A8A1_9ROSI|nr:uncharacterized protein LOC110415917 isoform X2 [Herrania umbratica]
MERPIPIRNEAEAAAVKRRESGQWRSKVEEYEMISDLSGFDNLRAMIEGEATVQRRKRRRKRKKKKNNHVQHPLPVDTGKPAIDTEQAVRTVEVSNMDLIEIPATDVPQKLAVDTAVKESKMIATVQAVKSRTGGNGNEAGSEDVFGLFSSSSEDDNLISNISTKKSTGKLVSVEVTINKDSNTVWRNELKTVVAEETVDVGKREIHAANAKCVETLKLPETEPAQNTVLPRLLRKPRYFDSPTGFWARCFSSGEDHPAAAANCTLPKRLKPCFLCGSLQHNGKHCLQGLFCFVCREEVTQANCPEKQEENNLTCILCLRCGDSGHDMFSCRRDYSPDDLKKIQCYVCNGFGHLSCVNVLDTSPAEVSCYNCGQSGHLGSESTKFPKVPRGSNAHALCYRCREEGQFARTCTLSRKHVRRVQTEMRRSLESSSAPPSLCEPQNEKYKKD